MKRIFFLVAIIVFSTTFAQDQHFVDSFETKLKKHDAEKKELGNKIPALFDSTAANIYNQLSQAYWGNNLEKAIDYANQCLALSERIGYKKGIANAFNSLGVLKRYKGDYLSALEFHKKALKIREEIGDQKGISASYVNIGAVYQHQGNYPGALKNYFASLKKNEEIGNKYVIAISYNNIGLVYQEQGNYSEALKNLLVSLKIREAIGDKLGISDSYINVGMIYEFQFNFPEALRNYLNSLKIKEEIGDKSGIATSYNSIGNIYQAQNNYPEALKNQLVSLKIREEMGEKEGIALSCESLGNIYFKEKRFNSASEYFIKGLALAKEIGSLYLIKSSYGSLAALDSAQGNYNKALRHYKLFITFRDSLNNGENTKKTVALQMNYDFDKKQDSLNALQANKDAVASVEIKKQKQQKIGLIAGLSFMIVFAMVFLRQRNHIKAGKKRSDDLLLNILPAEVAEELKDTGHSIAKSFESVTVMFTDFKGFTHISEKMSPKELVKEIDYCFSSFDNIIHKHNVEKIKTIGDSYMCVGGLPKPSQTHAEDTVKAALEIRDFMNNHNLEKMANGELPFEIRIGVNTGPVVAGIVGVKKFAYDIWGDTVNLANRMESSGEAGKVNVSGSTYELIKDRFSCEYRGKIQTKNKGEVDMYFVS